MEAMNLDAISLLWSVVLLPIGWLVKIVFMWVKRTNEKTAASANSTTELRVREILKEEVSPLKDEINNMRADFKTVNSLISEATTGMDSKLNNLMLSLLNRHSK